MTDRIMKRNKWATQGRCLIEALKKRPMTYGDMLALGLGNSPWKRVMEALDESREQLLKSPGPDKLLRWRVVPKRSA